MLIKGTPSMLAPPTNPLGFSGLSLSGSLGYVDSETPRTQYTGAPTDWDIFRDNLFFGNRALRDDPAHPANIFGSYYDPRVWGSTGTVQLHQRDLLAHWKRVLSMFAGATWNDIALAYGVPQSTIAQFAAGANAAAFPIIKAVWQNSNLPDTVKRPALGLIVQRFGLSPWEWANIVGLDEVTAAQVVAVPMPAIAATSFAGVVPAVQATPTSPGYVVETRTGEVAVIPAGSEPFIDAAFTNDVQGRRVAVLTYAAPGGETELFFIDPKAPLLESPIAPSKLARLRELLNLVQRGRGERERNIVSNETANFDRYLAQAAALVAELGLTESELAQFLGYSLAQFREVYVFDAAGFGIKETRQAMIVPSELPELLSPSQQALEPVQLVFYFDFPVGFADAPAAAKAAFYLSKLDAGFTDAQIRITAESAFGPQADADWGALRNLAAAQRAAEIAAAAAAAAAVMPPPPFEVMPPPKPQVGRDYTAEDMRRDLEEDERVRREEEHERMRREEEAYWRAVNAKRAADAAAEAAAKAARDAAAAADAGDTAGVASATTIAITASDTATNAVRKMPPFDPNSFEWKVSAGMYNKLREQGRSDAEIRKQVAAGGIELSDADWSRFTAFARSLPAPTKLREPPTLPFNLADMTLEQKRATYADLIKQGYSDAEIRAEVEHFFGKQDDAQWAMLSATTGANIAPLLVAVAAAYILGA